MLHFEHCTILIAAAAIDSVAATNDHSAAALDPVVGSRNCTGESGSAGWGQEAAPASPPAMGCYLAHPTAQPGAPDAAAMGPGWSGSGAAAQASRGLARGASAAAVKRSRRFRSSAICARSSSTMG